MKRIEWVALALLCGISLVACGNDETTGKRVILRTRVVPDAEAQLGFTTLTGWNIKLTKAALATGPLYYFDGSPAFVMFKPPSYWQRVGNLFESKAFAHPGHYAAGVAKGQMLTEFSVDLLAPETLLPTGQGVSGLVRSATFAFAAPIAGAALPVLGANSVVVAGLAQKDEKKIHFTAATDIATIASRTRDGLVEGCTFDTTTIKGNGLVTVKVKPHIWFNLVDFSTLAAGTEEAPTAIDPGSTAQIAFTLGVVQLSAYHFSFQPDSLP